MKRIIPIVRPEYVHRPGDIKRRFEFPTAPTKMTLSDLKTTMWTGTELDGTQPTTMAVLNATELNAITPTTIWDLENNLNRKIYGHIGTPVNGFWLIEPDKNAVVPRELYDGNYPAYDPARGLKGFRFAVRPNWCHITDTDLMVQLMAKREAVYEWVERKPTILVVHPHVAQLFDHEVEAILEDVRLTAQVSFLVSEIKSLMLVLGK